MPINTVTLNVALQWALTRTNSGGFANTTQGADSLNFTLSGINTSTFNQLYVTQLSLAASASTTLDLTSLTNLVYESFSFGHVITIMVLPVGNNVTIEPGASNPLQWFFGGTTQTILVDNNGCFLWSNGASATGTVVNSTNKTLKFTNSSGASNLIDVLIIGSTT